MCLSNIWCTARMWWNNQKQQPMMLKQWMLWDAVPWMPWGNRHVSHRSNAYCERGTKGFKQSDLRPFIAFHSCCLASRPKPKIVIIPKLLRQKLWNLVLNIANTCMVYILCPSLHSPNLKYPNNLMISQCNEYDTIIDEQCHIFHISAMSCCCCPQHQCQSLSYSAR